MKVKKLKTKLTLNKTTISNLSSGKMKEALGGFGLIDTLGRTCPASDCYPATCPDTCIICNGPAPTVGCNTDEPECF